MSAATKETNPPSYDEASASASASQAPHHGTGLTNFDVCALREQIMANAVHAYPKLVMRLESEHAKSKYGMPQPPIKEHFEIVLHETSELAGSVEIQYVANLIATFPREPRYVHFCCSKTSYEDALKALFRIVSKDVYCSIKDVKQWIADE